LSDIRQPWCNLLTGLYCTNNANPCGLVPHRFDKLGHKAPLRQNGLRGQPNKKAGTLRHPP
jgi:hypothetical protein